jgi:hypothetical protein
LLPLGAPLPSAPPCIRHLRRPGEKRPADTIGNAVIIAKIAAGEIDDITIEDGKNAAAVALGRMGGKARAEGMTAKRRKEIAKKAAEERWKRLGSRRRSRRPVHYPTEITL